MTEFMAQIQDVLADPTRRRPGPQVRRVDERSVGHGALELVELRSLAEQLVCEANAVLSGSGRELTLEDEAGEEHLAFTLRSGQCWARVMTAFAGRRSWGQLVTPDSVGPEYELAGVAALPELLVALVAATGTGLEVRR